MRKDNLKDKIVSRKPQQIEFEELEGLEAEMFLSQLNPGERIAIEVCLAAGATIAGGAARYVCETVDHTGTFDDVDMKAYRQFGDVDIFFETPEQMIEVMRSLKKGGEAHEKLQETIDPPGRGCLADGKHFSMEKSIGDFAINLEVVDFNSRNIPIQLIKCQFGDPQTVIARFDFLNSMVAFYRKDGKMRTLRPKAWLSNERSNCLSIFVWESPFTFYRMHKYISKYGYETINPADGSWDKAMADITQTMDSLPDDPEDKTGTQRISRVIRQKHLKERSRRDDGLVFTQQSFARNILTMVQAKGHLFPDDFAVFLVSLAMATGIVNEHQGASTVRSLRDIRERDSKIKPRVVSWKESTRKALEKKEKQKEYRESLYSFTTTGKI